MSHDASRANTDTAFFAVASLGKGRWYWVAWPSLQVLRSGGPVRHLAEGYSRTKAMAVEGALRVAGSGAERVAARYARAHHRQLARERRAAGSGERGGLASSPQVLEFLYRDVRDEATGEWTSVPHRVVRRTAKTVVVEHDSYDAEARTGSWLDHGRPTYRLNRLMLEREGYAYVPVTADVEDPLFFTTPYADRVGQYAGPEVECLSALGLTPPCTPSQVRAAYRRLVKRVHPDHGGSHEEFLALRVAYEEALDLCRGVF